MLYFRNLLSVGVLLLSGFLSTAPDVHAVINPALQPDVYYDKYPNVLVLKITEIEAESATVRTQVIEVIKGTYTLDDVVSIRFSGGLDEVLRSRITDESLSVGDEFPVFAGKPSRRKSGRQVRAYADEFYVGEVKQVGEWVVGESTELETDADGNAVNTLAGIYCGMTSELINLVRDMEAESDFYPRKAYVKFEEDRLIDTLEGSVEGIAMYDLNGDGLEDIVAASPAGDRVYLQVEPMVFKDSTDTLGIHSKSVSCSVADVDCDGLTDLMLGHVIYRGQFENNAFSYVATDWLNIEDVSGFKSASFVELTQDGYPDVVVSIAGQGLRAFVNLVEPMSMREVTEPLQLDQAAFGAGGDGYFFAGDWNGDQRTDLFYAHGNGYILQQTTDNTFEVIPHKVDFSFRTGLETYGQTGAGVFMTTFKSDQPDLVVPIEKDWLIITNNEGTVEDITKWGNEISEGSDYHLATVTADLNLDGYNDLYTISDEMKENRFIINRGYGSYMHAKVHVDEKPLFKGPAHGSGGRSVALGDINGDGAPDILIGNSEGHVFLILNDTLSMRESTELQTKDERRLSEVRICSVRVLGPKGVVGAKVRLLNSNDQVVVRRDLAGNIATGCSSPDLVDFAVREAGLYTLHVTYSDGYIREVEVDLNERARRSVVVQRLDGKNDDGW